MTLHHSNLGFLLTSPTLTHLPSSFTHKDPCREDIGPPWRPRVLSLSQDL